jgi:FAD binding domain/Ig-like domain from next to BRCA1 gene
VSGPTLTVTYPVPFQEFPVGADIVVHGIATGTGGAEPHPIDSVTVRVAGHAAVDAELRQAADGRGPNLSVAYSGTVRLDAPGTHEISVTATDDVGRRASRTVSVGTPGMTNCQSGVEWQNYALTQRLTPESTCLPESLAGIVALIREAERAGKRVHAFGTKWSFSDCAATSDRAVHTAQLFRPIQTVQHALRPGIDPSLLYHVEAGISICGLYRNLNRLGLALETMGGASGQTLAGAISTGTHGGDKFMPPLADSVLAIHLVGAGGRQFWIEPSKRMTRPSLLRKHVVPDVDRKNIIYDDAVFDACLVSLGCMGIIYAVVLRVREPYDLVETTTETTWEAFKARAATYLRDPTSRFLQVIVNPYRSGDADHLCLVMTRSEDDDTGPGTRPRGDVEGAVTSMIEDMGLLTYLSLSFHRVFETDYGITSEQRLVKIIQGVLTYASDQRHVMVEHYGDLMRAVWPTGTFRGSSYSVMDLGYGQFGPGSQPVNSMELFFPAIDAAGRLGCADFIDALISIVNSAEDTFFTGYVSLRFTGGTRASLGGQQWSQTCAVEISLLRGVQGVEALTTLLYQVAVAHGAIPHWGQLLDLGIQGYGGIYPRYAEWRKVYAKLSHNFASRTFANELSSRWNLTTLNGAQFVSQTVSASMVSGQSQTVTVKMRNTGASTWTAAASYRLGSQSPQDSATWGVSRQDVPQDVPPGATVSFQFNIRAPTQPGDYAFQWRMVQEQVEWFGDFTPLVGIGVDPPAGQTIVPDVVESNEAGADADIRAAGLVPRFNGDHGAGAWVLTQAPHGGQIVAKGTTVTCQLTRRVRP